MSIWRELKRRDVFRVAVAYLVASWLIVQVVGVLTEPLNLPDSLDTVVVVLLAIGFPVALVIAWVYDLTPEGVKVTGASDNEILTRKPSGKRLTYVVIGLLVMAVGLMAADSFLLTPSSTEFGPGSRLAVLPCDDLSPDPTDSFFAVGIHEELLNRLASLSSLVVLSRTSVQQYQGRRPPIPEIAATLNADAIIECSARYAGDRVQLTTQLIDGASDAHIWVNAYQANMSNPETVFEIQADIAMQVANALHVEFFGSERAEIERVPTQSREAYELYLAAQPGNSCAFADPCNPRAVELLDQALLLDDQFAEAWAKKAYAHSNMHVVRPDEADLTAAIYAAERAIDLAPDRGDGYAMRAVLLGIRSDWIGADAAYEQARRFGISPAPDPRFLTAVGDIETALEVIESQLDTDPLNAELFVFRFFGQEILGNQEAANETFERGQRLFRNNWGGAGLFNFIDLGRGDAGPVYERAVGNVLYSELIALLDDPDQALALINDLSSNRTPANLGTLAVYAAFLGDQQLAVRLFRDAVSDYGVLMFMAWLPVFDEVRQLPEFKELLRDIGLVDYWRATDWPSVCRPIGADFECA